MTVDYAPYPVALQIDLNCCSYLLEDVLLFILFHIFHAPCMGLYRAYSTSAAMKEVICLSSIWLCNISKILTKLGILNGSDHE